MKGRHLQLGKAGENRAAAFLKRKGYELLERNYRVRSGEIDLIAKDKGELVFCEVKTRCGTSHGLPQEGVHYYKKKHLIHAAKSYIGKFDYFDTPARFDVIEVFAIPGRWITRYQINHIKDAFYCDDL